MKRLLILLVVVVFQSTVFGQETGQEEKRSLMQQYQGLNSDMEVIDGYRMVKLFTMDRFMKTVMDSLNLERQLKNAALEDKESLNKEIASLKKTIEEQKASIDELAHAEDHIGFLGFDFTKAGFVTVASIVAVVLLTLLVLSLMSTRMSYMAVKDMKRLYENTNLEFERYKHNAVEKEIKISRELQDYKNRVGELRTV